MSLVLSKYRCVCHVPSKNVPTHNDPKKSVPSAPIAGGGDDDEGGVTFLPIVPGEVAVEKDDDDKDTDDEWVTRW